MKFLLLINNRIDGFRNILQIEFFFKLQMKVLQLKFDKLRIVKSNS